LIVLTANICDGQAVGGADIYTGEFEKAPNVDPHFKERIQREAAAEQEKFRGHIPITDAVGDNVPTATALKRAARQQATPPTAQPAVWWDSGFELLLSFAAVLLAVGLGIRKVAPGFLPALNAAFNPWVHAAANGSELSMKVRAEEATLAEFLTAFRAGPMADESIPAATEPSVRAERLRTFYEKSVNTIQTQRQILREIERMSDEAGRQKLLAALRWEMHLIRGEAGVPELLPVWQLAFAVEGLLKQLTDNAANLTHSTLRTLAGGLELLAGLCQPGVAPDLLTRQPLRLLAVDDDPISRKAVSLALQRALNEPELAEDGEAALVLASRQSYDVIFLDVEMPGMDGFELCSRIHQTEINGATPIVFVTGHSDFDSRARSTLSGGSDLIGKPFLTFEISVKALTLALSRRLEAWKPVVVADTQPEQSPDSNLASVASANAKPTTDSEQASRTFAGEAASAQPDSEPLVVATEFLMRASTQLAPLRSAFRQILQTTDEKVRQDLLADVFLQVHAFIPKDGLPNLHPAFKLSSALEGLLRKLLDNPSHATGSTLFTLAKGVELLDELFALEADSDLMTNPPIHLLVVDDDPVARRAIAMALQMMFEKPDTAESGDSALTLASDRPYDVIFMDVQMPGLDGFSACAGVRQTTANRTTPVVFVTSHNDSKTRNQMVACGGNDFLGKPFLTSEITLKALSFALRGRLEKLKTSRATAVPTLAN